MSAEGAGWDWLVTVAGSGVTALVVTLFLHYADKGDQVEQWVAKDKDYRSELAGKLRGARIGATYHDLLTRGLDWLDRNWGSPGSARAFGVCIIIGLCYAYAAFFLAWGIGGPGHIGGIRLSDGTIEDGVELLGEMAQPGQGMFALWLVAAPLLGFAFGRFLGRQERRLKLRLRRGYRWRRRRFELGYRAALIALTVAAVLASEAKYAGAGAVAAIYAIGPIAGASAAQRCRSGFLVGLVAVLAGAAAGAGVFAWLVASSAVSFAGAAAGAVALVGISAMAGAVAGAASVAVVEATTAGLPIDVIGAGAGTVAVAVAAAIGVASARRSRQGAFAGGIGSVAGVGILFGAGIANLLNEFVVVLIIFFLVLPIVNGFWDWLSWSITRALGRHLLASFGTARGLWQRGLAVLGHGALDLVLAVALLAAMAFLLTFCFEVYNRIAEAQGARAFEFGPFLASAADRPWSDGLWLTVMLISTLVPTWLHVVALLASPLALVTLPTEKRLRLAGELESYDTQPERHASIQRRAGQYLARERHGAVALAAGLFVVLIAGLLALINLLLRMLEEGQTVAHLVLRVAEWGIAAARIFG